MVRKLYMTFSIFNLQHLDLIHNGITDAGAKCLAELRSLKTIDLRGTRETALLALLVDDA